MSSPTLLTVSNAPAAAKAISSAPAEDGVPLSSSTRALRTAVFVGLALGGVGLDLATKHYIFAWRTWEGFNQTWWLVNEHFGVQTSVNPGALFGMGAGYTWGFVALSFVALVAISYFVFLRPRILDWWLTVALGLVTGGILGNLYDRLGFWRLSGVPDFVGPGVRDWILVRFQGIPFFDPWPNFNIADCCLVVGACLLAVHSLRGDPKEPVASKVAPS
jgi:signal peptidase II